MKSLKEFHSQLWLGVLVVVTPVTDSSNRAIGLSSSFYGGHPEVAVGAGAPSSGCKKVTRSWTRFGNSGGAIRGSGGPKWRSRGSQKMPEQVDAFLFSFGSQFTEMERDG
ncbi:hypothetical protein TanjilG_23775 [Lupinus angustifolius]|nr:hypothetical protein TanjilG_23775 [Lupinus angustifolius]